MQQCYNVVNALQTKPKAANSLLSKLITLYPLVALCKRITKTKHSLKVDIIGNVYSYTPVFLFYYRPVNRAGVATTNE